MDIELQRERNNHILLSLIRTDLDVARTFCVIASTSRANMTGKRVRNIGNARKAYDTVRIWLKRVSTTDREREQLNRQVSDLRSVLIELGQDL